MEQHPVPQNILDVEFKLFGSFTLKQFGKMVIGSLIAVGIYLLPLDILIKFPLIAISVGVGVLSAMVENFQTWLSGFLKAVFISPRYVWIKDDVKSELLDKQQKIAPSEQTVKTAKSQKKIDINDIPLDQIFTTSKRPGASTAPDIQTSSDQVKQQNFGRAYEEVYDIKPQKQPKQKAIPLAGKQNAVPQVQTSGSVEERMKQLQLNLQMLDKADPQYKTKQETLMSHITELRAKAAQGRYVNPTNPAEKIVSAQGEILSVPSQIVTGIVVDNKDKPIPEVQITMKGENHKEKVVIESDANGKFVTPTKLPADTYDVELKHKKHKFHTYRFTVGNDQLPAYKFRTR